MRCLIVIAHPLGESLCHALAQTAITALSDLGHDIQVLDLYQQDFAAALTRAERKSYYQGAFDAQAVQSQVEQLLWAEALVLVFPTWWFGFPAMLKGWFDRVWAPGVAYDHASDFGPIRPRLAALHRVLAITTLGAAWWVDWLVLWRPVQPYFEVGHSGGLRPVLPPADAVLLQGGNAEPAKGSRFSATYPRQTRRLGSAMSIDLHCLQIGFCGEGVPLRCTHSSPKENG